MLRPRGSQTLHRLLAAVALVGAGLLLAAELSPLYTVVVGSLETPRRSACAGSNHDYAPALRSPSGYRTAVQSTVRSASVISACHVAASVVPVGGSPRAV